MKSSFTRTLLISFGISVSLLIITSVASFISIRNLLSSADLVEHTNLVLNKVEEVASSLKDAETGQRGYLLTGDEAYLQPYKGAADSAISKIWQVKRLTSDNSVQQNNCNELLQAAMFRISLLQRQIDREKSGQDVDVKSLDEGRKYMVQARNIIQSMKEEEKRLLTERNATMSKFASFTPVVIILASLLAIIITISLFLKIRSEFKQRTKLQYQLEEKDKETTHRIDIIQNLATKIAGGDYTIRLDEKEKDGLGSLSYALNKMTESLDTSFQQLSENEWLQKGIADLNNLMVGEQEVNMLTTRIIEFLAHYTNSQAGALYIKESAKEIQLSGSYSLRHDLKNQRLLIGEGVAGQCALSGKEIMVDVPDNDIYVSFATGEARPGNIVAIPVFHDNHVTSIIELASFTPFSERYISFLKDVAHNVGVAINSAQNRKRLQELLEETQSQTEELQAQHREMENLNSELETQTEKLQASEEELRVQQEELLQSNQELEERSRLLEEKNQVIIQRNKEIQQKAEELALSTKYKSEFLANMSHELRTPLNSILLLSRLMSENKDQNLNSDQVSYAKVIRSSGEGLLNLIDEILDLSKIEAGKMNLEVANVQVKEVLDDMYSLFTPLAAEKKLDLKSSIGKDVPPTIRTDKVRLEQILKNLLSNAIKFTSKGYISLDITINPSDRNYIDFIVRDTGIGIAPDKQQLVFEAFQQEDGSTRRKYGGTGLGLSITRELTKLLKGRVTLNSKQDKGTEFIISIPLTEDAGKSANQQPPPIRTAAATEAGDEKENNTTQARQRYINPIVPSELPDDRDKLKEGDKVILIIEDDTNFAKILMDFSHKNGYKVLSAVTGDQGIQLAQEYKPMAILLDIMLPVKDGWEVMEALKSDLATRHIPVHIMSALEVKKEGLSKGAVDFLNKPVVLDQLRSVFGKLEDVLTKDNKKVLIIEENPKHAQALAYFLESFNIKSEIRNDIEESTKALQQEEINCVILDMGLPDRGTYEMLETIKKNPGLENLPIIVFTGKNLSKSEESRIRQYADSIVVKTAHSYQRIIDEVSLFLHLVAESNGNKKGTTQTLGAIHEVLKGKTVLVADDDVRNVFSLTKILEQYKINVISATDGKDALKQLEQNPKIDLVLMDMMMPEMDGYEATRKIREIPRFKKLPVLAVTAKAMMGDREKCIRAGASDYISKPVDMDQLVSLLRVWLYDSPGY